jgi:CRISPR-associated endonuclease/helicase Cas3
VSWAEVVVVGEEMPPHDEYPGPAEEDFSNFTAYLSAQDGQAFDATTIRQNFIQVHPVYDERVKLLFKMLYEYVYEAQVENKPLHDKGLVITRSWEPSITLTTKVHHGPQGDWAENAVRVPLSRLAAADAQVIKEGCLLLRRYDPYEERFRIEEATYGGCAYLRDLVLEVPACYFDGKRGYVDLPKVFKRRGGSGYRRLLLYERDQSSVWLWYIDPDLGREQGAETAVLAEAEPDEEEEEEEEEEEGA